jgi:hypothetical protein
VTVTLTRATKFPVGKVSPAQDHQVWVDAAACRAVSNRRVADLHELGEPNESTRRDALAALTDDPIAKERVAAIYNIQIAYFVKTGCAWRKSKRVLEAERRIPPSRA